MQAANNAGLDLVEIQPNVDPPVCKILNYGKYKYEAQKRKNEARKKQKIIEVKEIKLRPNIDQHDFEVKMKSVKKFIDNGDKVKVFNDRGSFDGVAKITDDVSPGIVVATLGYWRQLNQSGTVNSISTAKLADMGNAPTFSDNLVEFSKLS